MAGRHEPERTMIHRLLRAALAVAALSSFSAAQEGGSTTTETPRVERPLPPKAKGDAAAAAARERLQKFLAEHPELKQRLHAQADVDGDGKLDAVEKKRLHELIEQRMREAQARRDERREDRRDERQEGRQEERRDDRRDERREERRERADRDGDGRIEPVEKKRAQQVRGQEGCEHCREKPAAKPAETPRTEAKPTPKPKPKPAPQSAPRRGG
jgi:hypothetical protein